MIIREKQLEFILLMLSTTCLCVYFDWCYYCSFVFFLDGQIDHIDCYLSIYISFFSDDGTGE